MRSWTPSGICCLRSPSSRLPGSSRSCSPCSSTSAGGCCRMMPNTKPIEITPRSDSAVRWDDVAGVDEVRAELQEVVEFLRHPGRFEKLGARVPRGVLLYGPPGHGQDAPRQGDRPRVGRDVLLPERLVVRRDVGRRRRGPDPAPFSDGAQEPARHHLHRRARRRRRPPARRRAVGPGAQPDAEPAPRRAGRVRREPPARRDRRVEPPRRISIPRSFAPAGSTGTWASRPPTCAGREQILAVHTRGKPLDDDVDLHEIARRTSGLTGADLANLATRPRSSPAAPRATGS